MPWLPELFSAPVVERIQRRAADERAAQPVPFFEGIQSGETDALTGSFAGEPELYHPVRGRIRGRRAFEEFVTGANERLGHRNMMIEDIERVVSKRHGFEEVVLHLDVDGPLLRRADDG